jgi:hypothetical protein
VRLLATLKTIYQGEIFLKKYQGEIGTRNHSENSLYVRDENSIRRELGLYVLRWVGNPFTSNCLNQSLEP